jgi:hypothetical protein
MGQDTCPTHAEAPTEVTVPMISKAPPVDVDQAFKEFDSNRLANGRL